MREGKSRLARAARLLFAWQSAGLLGLRHAQEQTPADSEALAPLVEPAPVEEPKVDAEVAAQEPEHPEETSTTPNAVAEPEADAAAAPLPDEPAALPEGEAATVASEHLPEETPTTESSAATAGEDGAETSTIEPAPEEGTAAPKVPEEVSATAGTVKSTGSSCCGGGSSTEQDESTKPAGGPAAAEPEDASTSAPPSTAAAEAGPPGVHRVSHHLLEENLFTAPETMLSGAELQFWEASTCGSLAKLEEEDKYFSMQGMNLCELIVGHCSNKVEGADDLCYEGIVTRFLAVEECPTEKFDAITRLQVEVALRNFVTTRNVDKTIAAHHTWPIIVKMPPVPLTVDAVYNEFGSYQCSSRADQYFAAAKASMAARGNSGAASAISPTGDTEMTSAQLAALSMVNIGGITFLYKPQKIHERKFQISGNKPLRFDPNGFTEPDVTFSARAVQDEGETAFLAPDDETLRDDLVVATLREGSSIHVRTYKSDEQSAVARGGKKVYLLGMYAGHPDTILSSESEADGTVARTCEVAGVDASNKNVALVNTNRVFQKHNIFWELDYRTMTENMKRECFPELYTEAAEHDPNQFGEDGQNVVEEALIASELHPKVHTHHFAPKEFITETELKAYQDKEREMELEDPNTPRPAGWKCGMAADPLLSLADWLQCELEVGACDSENLDECDTTRTHWFKTNELPCDYGHFDELSKSQVRTLYRDQCKARELDCATTQIQIVLKTVARFQFDYLYHGGECFKSPGEAPAGFQDTVQFGEHILMYDTAGVTLQTTFANTTGITAGHVIEDKGFEKMLPYVKYTRSLYSPVSYNWKANREVYVLHDTEHNEYYVMLYTSGVDRRAFTASNYRDPKVVPSGMQFLRCTTRASYPQESGHGVFQLGTVPVQPPPANATKSQFTIRAFVDHMKNTWIEATGRMPPEMLKTCGEEPQHVDEQGNVVEALPVSTGEVVERDEASWERCGAFYGPDEPTLLGESYCTLELGKCADPHDAGEFCFKTRSVLLATDAGNCGQEGFEVLQKETISADLDDQCARTHTHTCSGDHTIVIKKRHSLEVDFIEVDGKCLNQGASRYSPSHEAYHFNEQKGKLDPLIFVPVRHDFYTIFEDNKKSNAATMTPKDALGFYDRKPYVVYERDLVDEIRWIWKTGRHVWVIEAVGAGMFVMHLNAGATHKQYVLEDFPELPTNWRLLQCRAVAYGGEGGTFAVVPTPVQSAKQKRTIYPLRGFEDELGNSWVEAQRFPEEMLKTCTFPAMDVTRVVAKKQDGNSCCEGKEVNETVVEKSLAGQKGRFTMGHAELPNSLILPTEPFSSLDYRLGEPVMVDQFRMVQMELHHHRPEVTEECMPHEAALTNPEDSTHFYARQCALVWGYCTELSEDGTQCLEGWVSEYHSVGHPFGTPLGEQDVTLLNINETRNMERHEDELFDRCNSTLWRRINVGMMEQLKRVSAADAFPRNSGVRPGTHPEFFMKDSIYRLMSSHTLSGFRMARTYCVKNDNDLDRVYRETSDMELLVNGIPFVRRRAEKVRFWGPIDLKPQDWSTMRIMPYQMFERNPNWSRLDRARLPLFGRTFVNGAPVLHKRIDDKDEFFVMIEYGMPTTAHMIPDDDVDATGYFAKEYPNGIYNDAEQNIVEYFPREGEWMEKNGFTFRECAGLTELIVGKTGVFTWFQDVTGNKWWKVERSLKRNRQVIAKIEECYLNMQTAEVFRGELKQMKCEPGEEKCESGAPAVPFQRPPVAALPITEDFVRSVDRVLKKGYANLNPGSMEQRFFELVLATFQSVAVTRRLPLQHINVFPSNPDPQEQEAVLKLMQEVSQFLEIGGAILFQWTVVEHTKFDIVSRNEFQTRYATIEWEEFYRSEPVQHGLLKDWIAQRQIDNEIEALRVLYTHEDDVERTDGARGRMDEQVPVEDWNETASSRSGDIRDWSLPGAHLGSMMVRALYLEECQSPEQNGFETTLECEQAVQVEKFASMADFQDQELQGHGLVGAVRKEQFYFHLASKMGLQPHLHYALEAECPQSKYSVEECVMMEQSFDLHEQEDLFATFDVTGLADDVKSHDRLRHDMEHLADLFHGSVESVLDQFAPALQAVASMLTMVMASLVLPSEDLTTHGSPEEQAQLLEEEAKQQKALAEEAALKEQERAAQPQKGADGEEHDEEDAASFMQKKYVKARRSFLQKKIKQLTKMMNSAEYKSQKDDRVYQYLEAAKTHYNENLVVGARFYAKTPTGDAWVMHDTNEVYEVDFATGLPYGWREPRQMDEVEEEDDTFEARRGGWFGVIFSLLIVVGVQVAMLMFVLTRPEGSTQVELGSTGGAKADDDLEVALLNEEEEEEEEQAEIS